MRRYIAILLCMAVAAGVAACQPTPENPILVEKDSERLIEQAGKKDNGVSLSDMLALENNYQFNYMSQNGKLQIHADAFVVLPGEKLCPFSGLLQLDFRRSLPKKPFASCFPIRIIVPIMLLLAK